MCRRRLHVFVLSVSGEAARHKERLVLNLISSRTADDVFSKRLAEQIFMFSESKSEPYSLFSHFHLVKKYL